MWASYIIWCHLISSTLLTQQNLQLQFFLWNFSTHVGVLTEARMKSRGHKDDVIADCSRIKYLSNYNLMPCHHTRYRTIHTINIVSSKKPQNNSTYIQTFELSLQAAEIQWNWDVAEHSSGNSAYNNLQSCTELLLSPRQKATLVLLRFLMISRCPIL